ncbi:MAG TPA: helix-turn-helix transcriptional regulator [Actinophytocola sp.]|uniref:helix-turn-helix domain-containing protein n=1 Tax=Actinophytocola sp. TaxID=1872138 RepID=UPI002DBF164C|nr:helix-turn-helix transcriptional regulator [Actinophytocola sp.]HEU5472649.1 helix-turn-helix transcriptional regulator [Actinophytocola sp.]
MADNELGAFLRARRDATTPTDVGLTAGPRRRAPGLRRAELATLAGISVEYLARLEQGRDRHPSVQVLGALADALRMSADERNHLRLLAKVAGGGLMVCPNATPPVRTVRPTVRALLDRLEPTPAVLLNRIGDVLAHTAGYTRLFGPLGVLESEHPNLLRFVFTDPRARAAYPDWDRLADDLVNQLKVDTTGPDPHAVALADELTVTAGVAFARRWSAVTTQPARAGDGRLTHPTLGPLRLAFESLDLPDGQRMIAYLPADEPSTAALDRLTAPLRVVTG